MWRLGPLLAVACGRVAFAPLADSATDDGTDGPSCTFGPWQPPVELTALNTVANDWGPTLTASGLEIMWHSQRGGGPGMTDFYHSERPATVDPFVVVALMMNLSSPDQDENITLTRDGNTAYFTSTRTGATSRLFRATRPGPSQTFDVPSIVSELTNQVWGPTLSSDETELFFTSNIPTSDLSVASFDGVAFSQVRVVSELMTAQPEGYPALSPDGLTIYYDALRGGPDTNIYSATRPAKGQPFGAETLVVGIDSAADEADAELSSDGLSLYFSSSRPGTGGFDLYVSTRTCQ